MTYQEVIEELQRRMSDLEAAVAEVRNTMGQVCAQVGECIGVLHKTCWLLATLGVLMGTYTATSLWAMLWR